MAACALFLQALPAHAGFFNLIGSFGSSDLVLPSGSAVDDQQSWRPRSGSDWRERGACDPAPAHGAQGGGG